MTEYFEDMWIGLENELKNYDSFSPGSDMQQSQPHPETAQENSEANLGPETYEDLLNQQNAPIPSKDRLRNHNRAERIQAIKELYNKTPTIINWASVDRIRRVAAGMYRVGLVKEANEIIEKIDMKYSKSLELYNDSIVIGHSQQASRAAKEIFAANSLQEIGEAWKRLTKELHDPSSDLEECERLIQIIKAHDTNSLADELKELYLDPNAGIALFERNLKLLKQARDEWKSIKQPQDWDTLLLKYKAEDISLQSRIYHFFLEKAKEWLNAHPEDLANFLISKIPELRQYAEEKKQNTTEASRSHERLITIANGLARKGLVAEANQIIERANDLIDRVDGQLTNTIKTISKS